MTLYINGVAAGSYSSVAFTPSTNQFVIGRYYNNTDNFYLNGYISNARIINGTAVYTGNFTVPTAPLAITQSSSANTAALGIPTNGNSVYFDGTGDYLTVTDNANLELGSNDFTIEAWVYVRAQVSTSAVISKGANGPFLLYFGDNDEISFYASTTGSSWTVADLRIVTGYAKNTWHHVAITRSGTTLKTFFNGTQASTTTLTGSLVNNSTSLSIGYYLASMNGYISNLRITNGTALYTTTFTPSTTPLTAVANTQLLTCQGTSFGDNSNNNFTIVTNGDTLVSRTMSPFGNTAQLLTCQSSLIIDNSNNNSNTKFAITASGDTKPREFNPFGKTTTTNVQYSPSVNGGSMYFDGSGDYLTTTTNLNDLSFGTGDFTVECWMNFNSVAADRGILGSGTGGYDFVWRTSTGLNIGRINTAFDNTFAWTPTVGQWYHVAYSRSGSSLKAFVNGTQVGTTATNSIAYNALSNAVIGASSSTPDRPMSGYISDLRITKGKALYTSNFYPGSTPATPSQTIGVSTYNSSLLLSGTSGGIVDAHGSNVVETVGDVRLAAEDPYAGSYYSNYLDGSGDTVRAPYNAAFSFGTSNLTIECWLYNGSITNASAVGQAQPNGQAGQSVGLFTVSSGTIGFYAAASSGGYAVAITGNLPINQWNHVAGTRSGNTWTLWINGVSAGTATWAGTVTQSSADSSYGGMDIGHLYGSYLYTGYISNVRVVKGTALYTTTFTPSTEPLTAVANTVLLTSQSNKFKDNSTNAFTLTVAGNPKVKSFNPFQQNPGKSFYHDTNGDYLKIPYNPLISQTGPYTLEFWFYPTYDYTGQYIFAQNAGGAFALAWTGTVMKVDKNGVGIQITGSNTMRLNEWHHFAMTYDGTTTKTWANGQLDGSVSGTGGLGNAATTIGYYEANGSSSFGGYIKDFRFTRGVARYTTTFTPPTALLKAQ